MRHSIVVFILLILSIRCATMTSMTRITYVNEVLYSLNLSQVDRPKETRQRWGDVAKIELSEKDKYHYEDDLFEGFFIVSSDRIFFEIKNKTDHSIKIIWDEASFVDISGNSGRIMHSGVKYIDRNSSQPPSVVPAHGKYNDVILPSDRVWYREGYYGTYYSKSGGWEHLGLIQPQFEITSPVQQSSQVAISDSLKLKAGEQVGKRIGVLLPFEIQGVVNEYTFWFEVTEYNILNPVPVSSHPLFN